MSAQKLYVAFILSFAQLSVELSMAQSGQLKVGDPAPSFEVQEWIKGKMIDQFESGKFYLIELGAVGCAPCRLAIPHLSELARKYSERLVIISVYTMESNPKDPTDLRYVDRVKKFINSVDDKIDYSVVVDVPQQNIYSKWGKAAGLNGIPSAFLVDGTGHVVWFGYASGLSLKEILAAAFSNNKALIEEVRKRSDERNAQMESSIREIFELEKRGKMNTAVAKLDSLMDAFPENQFFYLEKFDLLARADEHKAKAYLSWMLNNLTVKGFDWFHLIGPSYEHLRNPDYVLSRRVADRAIEQAETKSIRAAAMMGKAHMFRVQGDLQSAINCCLEALRLATEDGSNSAYYEQMLAVFRKLEAESNR
jgi:thiol-disulfide isomerase/thioredoxin